MIIAAMTFRLHAPWVHSLKEKRMIVKSLALLGDNQNWDVFPFCTIEINEASSQQSKSQAGNMTVIEEEFVEPDNDV